MLYPLDGPAKQGLKVITTSPQELYIAGAALDERKVITIQPVNGTVRLTFESGQPGLYLSRGGLYSFEASSSQKVYAYTDSGSVNVILVERA